MNINYLVDRDRKVQIEALLKTYNLTSIVNFPTFCHGHWQYFHWHFKNGELFYMSNNQWADRQWCLVHSITFFQSETTPKKYKLIRKINEHTINDFLIKLNCESCDTIFSTDDVNNMFNSFLDSYLKIFYSSFPLKRIHVNKKNNNWITLGIWTSFKHKRELIIASRNSNNLDLKNCYKKCCKILSAVIQEAKKTKLCRQN